MSLISRERLIGDVFEPTPAVVADAETGDGFENRAGVRGIGVDDVGGDHGHFELMLANCSDERRQVFRRTRGFDVTAGANCDIDTVEAHFGSGAGEFDALEKLQVFRKDGNFQIARSWISRAERK